MVKIFERTVPRDLTPKAAAFSSYLSFSTLILDARYQNERYRQRIQCIVDALGEQRRRGDLLDSLSGKRGGLLKFPARQAA
jgi:hypothetical protein